MTMFKNFLYVLYSRFRYANYYRAVKRGMKVGKNFFGQNSIYDKNYPWLINIGNNVTITHSTILTHDESMKTKMNYTKLGVVVIGDNVFVGFNSTILPGVHIGENAIIAAGSLVTHDVDKNTVVAGVPAKQIKTVNEFFDGKYIELQQSQTLILDATNISKEMQPDIYAQLSTAHGKAYIK